MMANLRQKVCWQLLRTKMILLICAHAAVLQTITPARAASLITLASFNGANGSYPAAGLLADSAGNLFGTTSGGGANGRGTVFKLAAGANAVTTLISFNGTNGDDPLAGLISDAGGNLYSTTARGGTNGFGSIFKLAAGTYTLTTLASFTGTNGASPGGLVADPMGNMYGTTTFGGANSDGIVFKLTASTNALTTLYTFSDSIGRHSHDTLILDSGGNLYGTTPEGGASNQGIAFKLTPNKVLTTLATFNGTNGFRPSGTLLRDTNGNIYGATEFGGGTNGYGTVFKLAAGSNTLSTLVTFNNTNGADVSSGLIRDAVGNLFGTTSSGGTNGFGTVFKVTAGTNELITLANFNVTNGASPGGGLIADSAGNLYGTTTGGGLTNGTIFKLTDTSFIVSAADPTGDFNHDGRVDAGDYVLWRSNPAAFGGTTDGYNIWRSNFGNQLGSGSGVTAAAIPEPGTFALGIVCLWSVGIANGDARNKRERVPKSRAAKEIDVKSIHDDVLR